ncbi:MAG TPA: choice-of-anchor Q domain-containing protein, partial [Vicinamibacteria bacterium]|nr:choice-of-anchor Q domain-containing protein [Vicinamibacteria bacterium]
MLSFGWMATALAVTPHAPTASPVRLRLDNDLRSSTSPEGGTARLHVSRAEVEGDRVVTLELTGNATFDRDYALAGHYLSERGTVTISFPSGVSDMSVTVDIVDDRIAEGDEEIVIQIVSDQHDGNADGRDIVTLTIPQNDFVVTSVADSGEGSLRQGILNANTLEGVDTITFDTETFSTPRTISLESELPEIIGEVTVDGYITDRLWQATGVTIDGAKGFRVFRVGESAQVTIEQVTIVNGTALQGGGILNKGRLVVRGVSMFGNLARQSGGAILNDGGALWIINSTFADNSATGNGGGLANESGTATVTNSTFTENEASRGGGIFNRSKLVVANTILANSRAGGDCVSVQELDSESGHNLIETHDGCGTPLVDADPVLQGLGYYNGPVKTFPLGGGSPAINLGNNDLARDENNEPLVWDQRGNGDPRFVGGFTDIGAFEHQRFPELVVDTTEDTVLRACTPAGRSDCPLRGAIELANATPEPDVIRFEPGVFGEPRTIVLAEPHPTVTAPLTLDASESAEVT